MRRDLVYRWRRQQDLERQLLQRLNPPKPEQPAETADDIVAERAELSERARG